MDNKAKKIILLLASVQFIFTLDTTFMNVSISTLVKDLDTTVTAIQGAITFYTLVMAALMIAGAKVGDIIGRKKAFLIGLSIYALGSLITSLAPNIQVLIIGWSVLEGMGAALAIPAMMSLITGNFAAGVERAKAFGIVAAMAAVGAAAGPIVGGLLTTYASWRYGFAAEVLVSLIVLSQHKAIKDTVANLKKTKFDYIGFILSAGGLTIIVFGILLANVYGIFVARSDYYLGNTQIAHQGGVSPTIIFVIVGLVILAGFLGWQIYRSRRNQAVLINPELFKVRAVKSGSASILMQQFIMQGVIFSLALVLQIVMGYNAFQTGLVILPLSIMVLILATIGARLSKNHEPRSITMVGFLTIVAGVLILGVRIGKLVDGIDYAIPMAIIGAGVGLTASQLGNLVQSSVKPEQTSEASGLSSTFQNLGSSLGTAIAGSVMIAIFVNTSVTLINQNTTFNSDQKTQLTQAFTSKAQIVSNAQIEGYLQGQPQNISNEVIQINAQARDKALSDVVIILGVLGIGGLITSSRIPRRAEMKV
jgi:MFS family permease